MKNHFIYAQIYLRLALAIGFIYRVSDRIGWLGPAGQHNVDWGTWDSFLNYSHVLMPYVSKSVSDILGFLEAIAELSFGIFLVIGFQTRLVAIGSFAITLILGLSMAAFLGLKAPFNYSVFVVSAGALLLSALPVYRYSLDYLCKP